jgi:hypothetical protein
MVTNYALNVYLLVSLIKYPSLLLSSATYIYLDILGPLAGCPVTFYADNQPARSFRCE